MSAEVVDLVAPLIGGGGIGALVVGLLKWSGGRNIEALDKTIQGLGEAVAALTLEVQKLREAHIGLAKDVGALQEGQRGITSRVDGQAEYWRKQFEEHRQLVHDRMTQATHDMLETVEQVASKAKRR